MTDLPDIPPPPPIQPPGPIHANPEPPAEVDGDGEVHVETLPEAIASVQTSLAEAYNLEAQRREAAERSQRLAERNGRFWRRGFVLLVVVICAFFVWMIAFLTAGRHITKDNASVLADTHSLVQFIKDSQTPEAKAAADANTEKIIDELVVKLDCSQRQALQDTIDGLVKNRVLAPGTVVVTCANNPPPNG